MDPNDEPVALSKDAVRKQLKEEDRKIVMDILRRSQPRLRILAGLMLPPAFQLELGEGYLINGSLMRDQVFLCWLDYSSEDRVVLSALLKPYLQEMHVWDEKNYIPAIDGSTSISRTSRKEGIL